MKLHRLEMKNYRGIAHREILLPDSGVVVVSGANEIGKSSMIEALDLLLEAKDRSTKKEVKQVKPTHADVAAEVTAEISTGPYHFVYRKRFHKKCETELTVLAPRREQFTGDEAHDRVCTMLAETVDIELWRAQRVLQASSTAPVDLSGCDALARALDVAAGETAQLSGAEPVLVDRVDAEYARYFTPTGRATGEWAAANSGLAAAEADVVRCAAAVEEVDDAVRRHGELSEQRTALATPRTAAEQRLAAARAAADAVAVLTSEYRQGELLASAAQARHVASAAALTERTRLRADGFDREASVTRLEDAARAAAADEAAAREVGDLAADALERAQAGQKRAEVCVEEARRTLARLSDREEADRLAARLSRIDAVTGELNRTAAALAAISVTEAVIREIDVAAAAVERAADRAGHAAARIELTAVADVEIVVDGEAVSLAAGDTFAAAATEPTDIELPGLLAARILPGEDASDIQVMLDAAREHLVAVLTGAGFADAAAAHGEFDRRRGLLAERGRLTATLSGLSGDESVQALRSRLAALRSRESGEPVPATTTATAQENVDAALDACRRAAEQCETHRKVAVAATARLAEKAAEARAARDKLAAAHAELTSVREQLAARRATCSDDDVAREALSDERGARDAAAYADELRNRLAATDPDGVTAELTDAQRETAELTRQCDELTGELRDLATQLRVYGTEGRKGQLDAAETALEHARDEHIRVGRRARAAQLLRSVVAAHRASARLRYVEPFRTEVQRLGRLVFGNDFEVDIDRDLRICSRTVAGRTVPYESLSGGAKEQLGIVARLAGAALVVKEDAVPVIIDDGLGFSDADRLARMGAVFDAVGGDGQVVLLTCTPERYGSIGGAHRIH